MLILLLAAASHPSLLFNLAQTAAPTDLMSWLTGSAVTVLALVVVGFLKRWIVTGDELNKALDRAERAEAKRDDLNAYIQDRMLPTLISVQQVLARGVEVAATEIARRDER